MEPVEDDRCDGRLDEWTFPALTCRDKATVLRLTGADAVTSAMIPARWSLGWGTPSDDTERQMGWTVCYF